jgi:hypothetical protein
MRPNTVGQKAIRRLRLQPGDILLVRDVETAKRLQAIPGNHPFKVPIVVTRERVHRLSKDYLGRLLADTQQSQRPEASAGSGAA